MLVSITAASWKTPLPVELAVVVHKSNPLTSLSEVEVRTYYLSLSERNWPNTHLPIIAVQKKESCLEKELFCAQILHMSSDDVERYFTNKQFHNLPVQSFANDAEVLAFITQEPGAIGYVNVQSLTPQVRSQVKVLSTVSI